MFSVDKYLGKKFHIQHYNCWHFVRDVWFELTGVMLYDYTPDSIRKQELELAAEDALHYFHEEKFPNATQQPLIVLMRRPKDTPHIGVSYQGKVLHLTPNGVHYQPYDVACVGFASVKFYTTKAKS